jgi:C1A family cysteine protease
MTRKIARYGWRPQLPDARDLMLARPPVEAVAALPPHVDLRPKCPPVYDQGDYASCTGNAIAGLIQFDRMAQALPKADFTPSRLFIYYNERDIEGVVDRDCGAHLRDGLSSVIHLGACFEEGPAGWPYTEDLTAKPPPACYAAAVPDRALQYSAIPQEIDQLRACLAGGYPFAFGFTVYESFESSQVASSGQVPMPGPAERVVGGHAVMAVGYDDASQTFIVRNSWGPSWGQAGYFVMPYAYVTSGNLAADFWTIRSVTQ